MLCLITGARASGCSTFHGWIFRGRQPRYVYLSHRQSIGVLSWTMKLDPLRDFFFSMKQLSYPAFIEKKEKEKKITELQSSGKK